MGKTFRLIDLTYSDVKRFSMAIAFAFAAMSKGLNIHSYEWESRLLMGLATAALSAWITLAVVQMALRSRNFEVHGLPAFNAVHTQIRFLSFHICQSILEPSERANALLNSIFHSPITEMPVHLDELERMLIERANSINPEHPGPATFMEVSLMRNFYGFLDDWFEGMEPIITAAGENARHSGTVPAILDYRHSVRFLLNGIRSEETRRELSWIELINAIRSITSLNRGIYQTILAEAAPHNNINS